MKFKSLDISNYLINSSNQNSKKICIAQSDKDGLKIPLTKYAIGVTYKLKIGHLEGTFFWWRHYENLWRYEEGEYDVRHPNTYFTEIYDIIPLEVNENKVFSYYKLREHTRDIQSRKIDINDSRIPFALDSVDRFFFFKNKLYHTLIKNESFTDEQIEILLKEFVYKGDKKFSDIKKEIDLFEKLSGKSDDIILKREPIPEEVKFEVWRRDEAKCVLCGSQTKLEFDHIIPFSKGGSNTARNIQLLCETCNRKKGSTI